LRNANTAIARARPGKPHVRNVLPADADLTMLVAAIKPHSVCQPAHQALKEELDLDHFEGRSWRGLTCPQSEQE
jgi:SRSO17 transposase